MKEIHDDNFRFVPQFCTASLKRILLGPCPMAGSKDPADTADQALGAKSRLTDGAYK